MATPTLRPLVATDVNVLAALHEAAFSGGVQAPWAGTTFADLLCLPGTFGFLVVADGATSPGGDPVGFVLARRAADECEILTIAVNPDDRGRGVGRALMAAVFDEAEAWGTRRFFLEVADGNVAALALYRAIGFEQVGTRKNYYGAPGPGPRTDAWVMARTS